MNRRDVIHDIGYRPYAGERRNAGAIAASLFLTGLLNAFGFGRSAKSKAMPFTLLALNLIPAIVIVAVMVVLKSPEPLIRPAAYALTTLVLTSVFVASQGPVLFSRDLRHGTIVLYLARPTSSTVYALTRWGSLACATFLFLIVPVILFTIGALLAEVDISDTLADFGSAFVLAWLLALMLATIAGLTSALSTRRGFAVVGTMGALLFGYGFATAVQGAASVQDSEVVGQIAGLINPYSLYSGIMSGWLDIESSPTPLESTGATLGYAGFAVLAIGVGLAGLVLRYRKVAGR